MTATSVGTTSEIQRADNERTNGLASTLIRAWCRGEGTNTIPVEVDPTQPGTAAGWSWLLALKGDPLCEARLDQALDDLTPLTPTRDAVWWKHAMDAFSLMGLDHLGGIEPPPPEPHEMGTARQYITSQDWHPGGTWSVGDVCFNGSGWILRGTTVDMPDFGSAFGHDHMSHSYLVPERYLKFSYSPTEEFFSDLRRPARRIKGYVVAGLFNIHMAHVAELIYNAFAAAWTATSQAHPPEQLRAQLILPGVSRASCPWCVDLAQAVKRYVVVHFEEDMFRTSQTVCFGEAAYVIRYMRTDVTPPPESDERLFRSEWFGNTRAASAFRAHVLDSMGFDSFSDDVCSMPPKVVIIDRSGPSRRIANAHALRQALVDNLGEKASVAPLTYLETCPTVPQNTSNLSATDEALTLRKQIEVFSSATVIVAVHGAALVNLAFMAPGATLLELMPSEVHGNTVTYFGSLARQVSVDRVLYAASDNPRETGESALLRDEQSARHKGDAGLGTTEFRYSEGSIVAQVEAALRNAAVACIEH